MGRSPPAAHQAHPLPAQQGRDGGRRRGQSGEGEGLAWLLHLPHLPEAPRAEAPRAHPWQSRLLPPWTQPSWKRAARRGHMCAFPPPQGYFRLPLLASPPSSQACVCACVHVCVYARVCLPLSRWLPLSYSVSLLTAASASLCVSPSVCVRPWSVTLRIPLSVSLTLPRSPQPPASPLYVSPFLCLCHSLSSPPFLAPLSDRSLALGPSHIQGVSAVSHPLPGRLGCRTRALPTTASPPGSSSAPGS